MTTLKNGVLAVLCSVGGCLAPQLAAAQTPAAPQAPAPPARRPAMPLWTVEATNQITNPGGGEDNQLETTLRATRSVHLRSTLFFEIDEHNKYSAGDSAVLIGVGHAFGEKHLFQIEASAAFGLGDRSQIAEQVFDVQGSVRINAHVSPVFEFERSNYVAPYAVNETTVGLKIEPNKKGWIEPAYINTRGTISPGVTEAGHAVGLKASATMSPKVSFIFKGGYGHEHAMVDVRTVREVVRRLKQLTLEPGFDFTLNDRSNIAISYTYENKYTAYSQHGLYVDLTVKF